MPEMLKARLPGNVLPVERAKLPNRRAVAGQTVKLSKSGYHPASSSTPKKSLRRLCAKIIGECAEAAVLPQYP